MLANALRVAHTYRVSHDMSMLVEQAAKGLDDLSQFNRKWAPSGVGFVAFDRPLPVREVRGKVMLIHFLVWGPVSTTNIGYGGTATLISTFNDRWRQADQVDEEMHAHYDEIRPGSYEKVTRILGRWAACGNEPAFDGQRMGPALQIPSEEYVKRIEEEGETAHSTTNVIRYVHALWMMMNQTVARVEDEHIDRKARRRAEKHRLPPKVTVIKLRRETGERKEGQSDIEWQHRWMVKGHHRWQVCGPNHPFAEEVAPGVFRAWIWIDPYEKGPDGAPLIQSEKVYSLER
jgi:hypothetical protein